MSSLRSTEYVRSSGPGAEFLFALLRMFLISWGLKGSLLKVTMGVGLVRIGGNQWRSVRLIGFLWLYVEG